MRIHEEGWKFIGIFALVTLLFFWMSTSLGWIGVVLTIWCACFFRDPERTTPTRAGLIVSPADGHVVGVSSVIPPKQFDMGSEPRTRISIFLNVFDVHVNRIPYQGRIKKAIYHPGKFFNASLDKASEHNERQSLVIDMTHENDTTSVMDMAVVQIAGLIARRIRCDVKEGDPVLTGERFGLIRFGSRTDIYLPLGVDPLVVKGQYMIGGETVLADLHSNEPAREGTYR